MSKTLEQLAITEAFRRYTERRDYKHSSELCRLHDLCPVCGEPATVKDPCGSYCELHAIFRTVWLRGRRLTPDRARA
jgi:hypothetical protein